MFKIGTFWVSWQAKPPKCSDFEHFGPIRRRESGKAEQMFAVRLGHAAGCGKAEQMFAVRLGHAAGCGKAEQMFAVRLGHAAGCGKAEQMFAVRLGHAAEPRQMFRSLGDAGRPKAEDTRGKATRRTTRSERYGKRTIRKANDTESERYGKRTIRKRTTRKRTTRKRTTRKRMMRGDG